MFDDFLDALVRAKAPGGSAGAKRIWALSRSFFASHGFDKLIHVDRRPGGTALLTTLPGGWLARYHEKDYARIDPFFCRCCASFRPVSTGAAYLDTHSGLSEAQTGLIREASDFGMSAGFSVTLRLAGPGGAAGWNIGSSLSRREVDGLRADREPMLRLAARHAHDALTLARATAQTAPLSRRETECLNLLARGGRTKDIAAALGIGTAAVELYLRNARGKLGAATREQAVAHAVARGLIAV